jgi:hypothetical protein
VRIGLKIKGKQRRMIKKVKETGGNREFKRVSVRRIWVT